MINNFIFNKPHKQDVANSEYSAKNFVPYEMHWNENTILTKNNQLIQVVKISGFSFETADDEDVDIRKNIRNMLFKGMNSENIGLYFHVIRKQKTPYPENYVSIDMPDGFTSYLDQKWVNRYKNKKAFINELYCSVVSKIGIVFDIDVKSVVMNFFGRKSTSKERLKAINDSLEQLEEAMGRIMNTLRNYTPRRLGLRKTQYGYFSEIAEFCSSIVNCGESNNILYVPDDLSRYITNSRLYFGRKIVEARLNSGRSKFAGMVSLKEYGPKTWAGILDSFLQMPFEFIITQSFEFTNRQTAISKMQLQQNRMIQSEDKAVSQIAEISEALDKAMSGEIGFGKHHLSVMCISDHIKNLENYLSMASVQLTNTGGIGVRETVNMEPVFWAQIPGNFDYIVRASVVNTTNLASFNSFHNYPTGKQYGNYWGDAVTVLDTTSGTPYYFNFHIRDVGHTTIIGPTGAGKTVMMSFLCAQAQKFKCRLFFFDKDRGNEIFLRAINGIYSIIDPSKKCDFNPLQLPDTGENRTFILDWLKQLISVHGEQVTAYDAALLDMAINGNFKLDIKDRKLSNIAPFLGLEGPDTLAGRLSMWHSGGSHAKIFDNEDDKLDFTKSAIFGFEMAEVLKDKPSLGPVLSYLFHRINLSLDGSPTMIVLDEAWALIDNPIFAPRIKDWLKVLRKLNAFVVFATQSVEDASKSSISDTLIQQTATQIFLPNLKATSVYRTAFMLSEREFQLIKTTDPGTRYFLVKQANDAVVARIDLTGMDDIINILSGRAETVVILDEVRNKYGDNPVIWLPQFIKRVNELD